MRLLSIALLFCCSTATAAIEPRAKTSSVPGDADDCSIWVHPTDSSKSVIIGNDKKEEGALYVWDMEGNVLSQTETLNQPVNVDVRYDVPIGDKRIDIIACGIRSTNELKVYTIDRETRQLKDLTTAEGIPSHHEKKTYGFSLYRRPSDGELFAFISTKKNKDIHQIKLESDGNGKVKGTLVRQFGGSDQKSFVEGMCVDDALGFVYCSDETEGVLKYYADPALNNNELVHKFATDDQIVGDREGIALYEGPNGTGYLVLSSQGDHTLKVFRREGNNEFIATVKKKGATKSDGVAVTSRPILPKFPYGVVACHNDKDKNFVLYGWEDLLQSQL